MSLLPAVGRKLAFGILAMYLVFTLTFAFVALTPDPTAARVAYGAAGERGVNASEQLSAYREARNLDEPVLQRYVEWIVGVTTLDWGESFTKREPVLDVLRDRVPATAAYAVPAVLVAPIAGVAVGGYLAVRNRGSGLLDRVVGVLGYAGLGAPNFWLAAVIPFALYAALGTGGPRTAGGGGVGPVSGQTMNDVVFPAVVLSTGLFASQLRQARAEALEYVGEEFVKTVRAKGASRRRVLRHVMRNAAPPLLSLYVSDLMAILVVNVFVLEQVFFVEGIGKLGYFAILERDLPLIVGVTMFLAIVGIGATVASDLLQLVADPRARRGEAGE